MFLKELLSSRVLSPSSSSDHLHSCHLHVKVPGAFLLDRIYTRCNTGHDLFTEVTYLYCLLCARPLLRYLSFANGCDQRWMWAGLKASTSHMTPRSWELILAPVYRYLNGVRKFKQIFQSHMTSKWMDSKTESQASESCPARLSSSTLTKSESAESMKSSHTSRLTLHFNTLFIKNNNKKEKIGIYLLGPLNCLLGLSFLYFLWVNVKIIPSITLKLLHVINPSYLFRLTCANSASPLTL